MVLTDEDPAAAVKAWAPVLGRFDFFEPVELSDAFKPLVYELPAAGAIRADLAAVFTGPAARSVKHVLGTACPRADTAILMQYTRATCRTLFSPYPPLLEDADEGGV